ncbi:MAG: lysine N(6)-hydroxylase/L-ornithine N(5)-oxygenase family protein [Stackebrandtia sp.]
MTRSDSSTVHDVVGVGCGPFNLGLAALASGVDDLDVVVLDDKPEFTWHRGLMFDDAMLQVSFLADLTSLVAPTHPLSFLSYLHDRDRMYQFYVREQFHPTRREYEDYLRWAAARLPQVRFSHRVTSAEWSPAEEAFTVVAERGDGSAVTLRARHLALGIGTAPTIPEALAGLPESKLTHTGEYLNRGEAAAAAGKVTVVGSGQSGAEVMLDLLRRGASGGPAASWLTRTASFAPLDYSKLVLEMTTPSYVDYFHGLPEETRDRLVAEQWRHYKGISTETLDEIHDALYQRQFDRDAAKAELRCGVAVESSRVEPDGRVLLTCRHRDTGTLFQHRTDLVVAATGYTQRTPEFLSPIDKSIPRDGRGRFRVRRDHSVETDETIGGRLFVANADLHSHGVAAPDLGIGAVRNAAILNAVAGREVYRLPRRTAFTDFDAG